jgi:hypothetical protein
MNDQHMDIDELVDAVSDIVAIGEGSGTVTDLARGCRAMSAALCRMLGPGPHRGLVEWLPIARVVHNARRVPFAATSPGTTLSLFTPMTGTLFLNDPDRLDGTTSGDWYWAVFSHGYNGFFRTANDAEAASVVPHVTALAQAVVARETQRSAQRRDSFQSLRQAAGDLKQLADERRREHYGEQPAPGTLPPPPPPPPQ